MALKRLAGLHTPFSPAHVCKPYSTFTVLVFPTNSLKKSLGQELSSVTHGCMRVRQAGIYPKALKHFFILPPSPFLGKTSEDQSARFIFKYRWNFTKTGTLMGLYLQHKWIKLTWIWFWEAGHRPTKQATSCPMTSEWEGGFESTYKGAKSLSFVPSLSKTIGWTSQPINQPTNQLSNQLDNQPVSHPTSQPINQLTS